MSEPQPPEHPAPSPAGSPLVGCLLAVIGIVLLLPGVCSVVFSVILLNDQGGFGRDPTLWGLLILCFAIGVGGVALIVSALRRWFG
jgi:hypothetical protein